MANDFKSLWRKEVEKLNRQIHKYEKEGVRLVYKAIDEEETPKKTYTQADVDLIKAKRLTLFEGATLYDIETGRTYKGKEEITQRIRQRNQQQKQMVEQHNKHRQRQSVKPKKTKKVASLEDSIAFQLLTIAQEFDARQAFPANTEWYYQQKEQQAQTFVSVILQSLNVKGFSTFIEPHYELVEELKAVLYDSGEFVDTPRSSSLIGKIIEFARKSDTMNEQEIADFYRKYGVEYDESDGEAF